MRHSFVEALRLEALATIKTRASLELKGLSQGLERTAFASRRTLHFVEGDAIAVAAHIFQQRIGRATQGVLELHSHAVQNKLIVSRR